MSDCEVRAARRDGYEHMRLAVPILLTAFFLVLNPPAPMAQEIPAQETVSEQSVTLEEPADADAPVQSDDVGQGITTQAPADVMMPARSDDAGQSRETDRAANPSPSDPAPENATTEAATTAPEDAGTSQAGDEADAPAPGRPATADAADPALVSNQPHKNLPHNLSPWGMFMAADWVVKAVMIGLAVASFMVWTIWVAKSIEIFISKRNASRAVKIISSAATLEDASGRLSGRRGVCSDMLRSAADELERSQGSLDHAGHAGVKERLGVRLARIQTRAGARLARGTGFLATVGATAPFIGLFGTVWGIMNSFIGISQTQTTNLAVVAPGIAEALLATGIGLVAAIPAVIIYNGFARSLRGYRQLLGDAAAGIDCLLSRDLDFRKSPSKRAAGTKAAKLRAVPNAAMES